MMSDAICRRWGVCCEEAAHGVVADTLGLSVGEMSVAGTGGHTAFRTTMADLRSGYDLIATAAGCHGFDLAEKHLPPPLPSIPETAVEAGEPALPDGPPPSTEIPLSDEQVICKYLNAAHGGDTNAWLQRYDAIHDEARAIVLANEKRIIDLARKLFLCGRLETLAA